VTDYVSKLGLDIETAGVAAGEKAMDNTAKAADRLENAAQGVQKAMDGASTSSAGAASSFQRQTEQINKLAQASAGPTSSLAEMGAQMARAAAQSDTLGQAAIKAQERLGAAAAGIKAEADAIRAANAAAATAGNVNYAGAAAGLASVGKQAKVTSYDILNLSNQFQDLGVQIASGGGFIRPLIQQGSQIAGVFGSLQARGIGFGTAMKSIIGSVGGLVVALAPLVIALGAAAGAFALFHREATKGFDKDLTKGMDLTEQQLKRIKAAGVETSVTMGDTFKATFQIMGEDFKAWTDKMLAANGTSWKQIGSVATKALDGITKALAYVFAFFRAGWESQVNGFSYLFKNLPAVIGDAFVTAFNFAGQVVTRFVNQQIEKINGLAKASNDIFKTSFAMIGQVKFEGIENPYKDAGKKAAAAFADPFKNIDKYVGDFYAYADRIGNRAKEIRVAEIKKAAGDAGKEIGENTKKATDDVLGLGDAWSKTEAALNAYGKAASAPFWTKFTQQMSNAEIGILNVTKALKNFNNGASSALARGYEAYERFLSDKEFELRYAAALQGYTAQQLKDAEDTYFIETKRTQNIQDMAERMRQFTAEAIKQTTMDGIQGSLEKAVMDLAAGSRNWLRDLRTGLASVLKETVGKSMIAGLQPAMTWLETALTTAFTKAGNSLTEALQRFGHTLIGFDKTGKPVDPNDPSAVEKVLAENSGLSGKISRYAQKAFEGYANYQTGQSLAQALGLGGKNPVQQQNSQIGSAIGTAIGYALTPILGPLGPILGSFAGGALGGLFGKGSNYTAAINYQSAGVSAVGIEGGKRTSETTSALQTVIDAVSAASKSLTSLGGTTSLFVKQLEIGVRDPGHAILSNGKNLFTAVADPSALANATALELLKATTFTNDALNKIKDGMIGAGKTFDETYTTIATVKQVLDSAQPALSDWQQKLKSLDDVFKPLIASTGAYTSALQDAYNTAKAALVTAFNDDIATQLSKLTTPLAQQFSDLLKTQTTRLQDATKLGADLAQVQKLNDAELTDFLTNLSNTTDAIGNLTEQLNKMVAAAQAAGQDTQPIIDAFNKAKTGAARVFDSNVANSINQLVNPTLASLKALLQQQKDRLANAAALGANVVAVERLNALETKNFFSQLSDQQKLSLGDYLGLIEDYTGKIGVILAQLNDQLAKRIDDFDKTKSALEGTISAWTDITKSLKATRDDIVDKYAPVTPLARINDLRGQFGDLVAKAMGGDQTSAGALPDLANKLIDLSRSLYGSTSRFLTDFDFVTKGLQDAGTSAQGQVDVAQSQLDTLIKQYDMLTQIKDVLSEPDPNLAYLANVVTQLDQNNQDIANSIGQYLEYQAKQAASNFTAGQIATATQTAIIQPTATQPAATTDPNMQAVLHQVAVAVGELTDQTVAADNAQLGTADEQTKLLRDIKDGITALLKKAA